MTKPITHPTSSENAAKPMSAADRFAPIAVAVLRGAARGLCLESGGFEAAELWLLDDESRTLGLAARWAVEGSSLPVAEEKRRVLGAAPADVAALAGGAVVIEEPTDALGWELHAPAVGAAIGLPVSSDTTIHGVLWLARSQPLTIADEAVELAEIVAARLALEVERHDGLRSIVETLPVAAPAAATPAEAESLPVLVDELASDASDHDRLGSASVAPVDAAAWTAPHVEGLAASLCWELPGDRMIALAAAAIDSPDSTTASQRAAVEWLIDEARQVAPHAADAGLLLTLLNRRLIESPLAGEGLAVAAALVDAPEDADAGIGGSGTWAFAGPSVAMSVRAAATDTHSGDLVPLGWSEPEAAYAPRPFELAIRQRLILAVGDPRLTSPLLERRLGDVFRAATSDAHRDMTAERCVRRLATCGVEEALGAVALRRE